MHPVANKSNDSENYMNIALLITALLFLINPSVAVFDILPDLFAWLIIFKLISKVKYLSVKMNVAAEYVLKSTWVGVGRVAAFFLIPYVDGTMELTLTFVFCILELVWGLPAIKYIYGGLIELSELYGGSAIYNPIFKFNKREGIRTLQSLSVSFWIYKAIFNVVPEFLELTGQSSDIFSEGTRTYLSFKPLLYYFTLSSTLIFGIIFVVFAICFFKRVFSDNTMIESINEAYKIKIVDTGIHNAKALLNSVMLITVAGLFVFALMLDSMNVMPRFLFPLILLFAFKGIKLAGYKTKGLVTIGVVSLVLSVVSYALRWMFVIIHGYHSISKNFEAYDFFAGTLGVVFAEMIFFAVLYIMVIRIILKIAADNSYEGALRDSRVSLIETIELKTIKIKAVISVILFVIGAIEKADSFVLYATFTEIWIIVLVIDLIWFLVSYSLYNDVKERIENKYLI